MTGYGLDQTNMLLIGLDNCIAVRPTIVDDIRDDVSDDASAGEIDSRDPLYVNLSL